MKIITLLTAFLSFSVFATCPVSDSSRCYSCDKKVAEYENLCGDSYSWLNITKVNQSEKQTQERELVFLDQNRNINIWLIDGNQCFNVKNNGRSVYIPITQREDWENFKSKKPEVEIDNECSSNRIQDECVDPLPQVTCVNKVEEIDGIKVCINKTEEVSYAWEKVVYEVREANGKNFCMKKNSTWVQVPPRDCLPCGSQPIVSGGGGSAGTGGGGGGVTGGGNSYTGTEATPPEGTTPGNTETHVPPGDQIIGPTMRSLGVSNV